MGAGRRVGTGRSWARAASTLVGACALGVALTACLGNDHGYVTSPDDQLALRYPAEWVELQIEPSGTEWVTGIDAAEDASVDHVGNFAVDAPFVLVQTLELGATTRDQYTVARLRTLALPQREDPTLIEDGSVHVLFEDPIWTRSGFEGQHLRFDYEVDGAIATIEQFAVLSPDRQRVHRVRVACETSCFDDHDDEIDALFDSIEVRR